MAVACVGMCSTRDPQRASATRDVARESERDGAIAQHVSRTRRANVDYLLPAWTQSMPAMDLTQARAFPLTDRSHVSAAPRVLGWRVIPLNTKIADPVKDLGMP